MKRFVIRMASLWCSWGSGGSILAIFLQKVTEFNGALGYWVTSFVSVINTLQPLVPVGIDGFMRRFSQIHQAVFSWKCSAYWTNAFGLWRQHIVSQHKSEQHWEVRETEKIIYGQNTAFTIHIEHLDILPPSCYKLCVQQSPLKSNHVCGLT